MTRRLLFALTLLGACRAAAPPLPASLPTAAPPACVDDPRFVEWPPATDVRDAALRAREAAAAGPAVAVCFDVVALPGVLTCVFAAPRPMNYALGRASVLIETTRGLIPLAGATADLSIQTGAGYDLRGEDLRRFRSARAAALPAPAPPPGPDADLAELEAAFDQGFLGCRLERRPDLVLLGVPANAEYFAPSLAHELLHAQFFTDLCYRSVVVSHWTALPDLQRRAFELVVAGGYDTEDGLLMANELAAYSLMRPRLWSVPLFDLNERPLRSELAEAGCPAIDVWGRETP